jgi:hypothetical protein
MAQYPCWHARVGSGHVNTISLGADYPNADTLEDACPARPGDCLLIVTCFTPRYTSSALILRRLRPSTCSSWCGATSSAGRESAPTRPHRSRSQTVRGRLNCRALAAPASDRLLGRAAAGREWWPCIPGRLHGAETEACRTAAAGWCRAARAARHGKARPRLTTWEHVFSVRKPRLPDGMTSWLVYDVCAIRSLTTP